MKSIFGPEFFSANRQRLRQLCPHAGPIIVAANGILQRNGDNIFPFRQDSSFWYLTGLNEPDLVLVMSDNDEYLIVPERNTVRSIFDGALDYKTLSDTSSLIMILDGKTGWLRLKKQIKKSKSAHVLKPSPNFVESQGFYTNPARAYLENRVKEAGPAVKIMDARLALAQLRRVKQQPELQALQKAIDITMSGLMLAREKISSYKHEYEIQADLTANFMRSGAKGHAYYPIIASGQNACTLHYVSNSSALQKHNLLLIDAGAEYENYAADITRTYPLGQPTKRQKAVHDAVWRTQELAFSLIRPGMHLKDYSKQIEKHLGEELKALKLVKSPSTKEVRRYCPHSISHFLGLDVHDVGDYNLPLEPGMVLTVEPGIYIPEEGIGVRIEDDVLVTRKGLRVLSSKLDRSI